MTFGIIISLVQLMFIFTFSGNSSNAKLAQLNCSSKDMIDSVGHRELSLPVPVVFYQVKYSNIIIGDQGYLSFQEDLGGYTERLGSIPHVQNIAFLSPLWTFTFSGGQLCILTTQNQEKISRLKEHLEIDGNIEHFMPQMILVVHWIKVNVVYRMPDKNQSFQVIIATDGEKSFSRFFYENLQHSTDFEYIVGFNKGDGKTGLQLLHHRDGTLTPAVEKLVSSTFRIDGNCVSPLNLSCDGNSYANGCSSLSNMASNCTCYEGFTKTSFNSPCIDINECTTNGHNCIDHNETCMNTQGSFQCEFQSPTSTTDEEDADGATDKPSTSANYTGLAVGLIIGVVVVVVVSFLIILPTVFFIRKRKNYSVDNAIGLQVIETTQRPRLTQNGSMMQLFKLPKMFKIPFEDLEFESKMIGEGEFGTVYKAKFKKSIVAVKILKGISGVGEVRLAVEEIMKMKSFSHPNVLTLTGVSFDHHFSPCIVMPFMENGSLDKYLQKQKHTLNLWFPTDEPTVETKVEAATAKLLDLCLQIIKGMAYLSRHKVIHRDLAARNCMVAYNSTIKVADFGLSVCIEDDKDYYRLTDSENGEKFPLKWMAVESLMQYKFSEASDVWSFGITCWEVFSCGKRPYPDIHNRDIRREVTCGYRMEKPQNQACNDSIFTIISSCWENEPSERPTFADLEPQISLLLQGIRGYLPLVGFSSTDDNHSSKDYIPPSEPKVNEYMEV